VTNALGIVQFVICLPASSRRPALLPAGRGISRASEPNLRRHHRALGSPAFQTDLLPKFWLGFRLDPVLENELRQETSSYLNL
jgi:hypothetical protein